MSNLYQYPLSNDCTFKLFMNKKIRDLNNEELDHLKNYLLFLARKTRKQINKKEYSNEKN